MRVLGIETSSRRGSVALVEGGRPVLALVYEGEKAHAEHLLPLVDRAFADAGWPKSSVDRIACGVGPGSFTGLRVGIALAQGIAVGLGRPALGVGALRAMARAVPDALAGLRCAMIDARKAELFVAAYDAAGAEHVAPRTVPRAAVSDFVATLAAPVVIAGEVAAELSLPAPGHRSALSDLPHATCVALLGAELDPGSAPPEPMYVRPPDAIVPNLPRSPLSSREPT